MGIATTCLVTHSPFNLRSQIGLLALLLVRCLYTLIEDGAVLVARVWKDGPPAR